MMSWSRKRAMRVPASMVVRMKSASNMMAKWYQYDIRLFIPGILEKISAMPTASVTAPPVRPAIFSPTPSVRRWKSDPLKPMACSWGSRSWYFSGERLI